MEARIVEMQSEFLCVQRNKGADAAEKVLYEEVFPIGLFVDTVCRI